MTGPQLTLMRLTPVEQDGTAYKPFSPAHDFSNEWWIDFIIGFDPTEQQF